MSVQCAVNAFLLEPHDNLTVRKLAKIALSILSAEGRNLHRRTDVAFGVEIVFCPELEVMPNSVPLDVELKHSGKDPASIVEFLPIVEITSFQRVTSRR